MNKISKLLAFLLTAALILCSLASCNNTEEDTTEPTTPPSENTSEDTSYNPETEIERFDYANADLSTYITVDPEIYKNLTLNIDKEYEVNDENLDKYINEILAYFPNITKVTDRPVESGDTTYIYYEGYIDGELFSGGSNMSSSSPYQLVIGSGAFIPGFEDALIGIIPADTSRENPAEINVRFPDSYHSADVAGKNAVFKVVIEYIEEKTPAELTEEFVINNFGYDPADGDVIEQFKALAREDLKMELRNVALYAIYDELDGKFTVHEYPELEITYHYNYLISYVESYYSYYSSSFASFDDFACAYVGIEAGGDWEAVVLERAKLYVEEALYLYAIVQKEGIVIDDARYQESLDYLTYYYINYYQSYGYSLTVEQAQMMVSFDMVIEHATTELFVDLILDSATIKFVSSAE